MSTFACNPSEVTSSEASNSEIIGGSASQNLSIVKILAISKSTKNGTLCTGTLISPTTVLTAAHCIYAPSHPADVEYTVYFEGQAGGIPASGAFAHPGYDPKKDRPTLSVTDANGATKKTFDFKNDPLNDVGIIKLATPQKTAWVPINTSSLDNAAGSSIHIVGYGQTDHTGTGATAGSQKEADTKINQVVSGADLFALGTSDTSTCHGDSGGPGIQQISGVNTVVGITSLGFYLDVAGDVCEGGTYQIRVDKHLDFIAPYITDIGAQKPTATTTPGQPDSAQRCENRCAIIDCNADRSLCSETSSSQNGQCLDANQKPTGVSCIQ